MSRADQVPNLEPDLVPEQRIKISLDYQDRKHSIFLPVWGLVLFAALFLAILVLVGVFAFRDGSRQDSARMRELTAENKYLSSRIAGFELELDSLSAILDSMGVALNTEQDYPYYSGNNEEAKSKLKIDPAVKSTLGSVESKLAEIWNRLGRAAPAEAYIPDGSTLGGADGIPSIYPTFGFFSDGWGMRLHPISDSMAFHHGLDIANEIGTPIYATADGLVSKVEYEDGFGKLIRIVHAGGYETLYGHLHGFRVKPGDLVHKGQIIALMGNSGSSTGPHLHYCVMKGGAALNPANYLNRLDSSTIARR